MLCGDNVIWIKVEEGKIVLYECKKFADFDSFNAEPYRKYVEYKADLYTEKTLYKRNS